MKTLFALLAFGAVPIWGGTVTMDFTVAMLWRFDLRTNAMDATFQPFTMALQSVFDDQYDGTFLVSPDTTQIRFGVGTFQINSPLASLVDMGYDVSTLAYQYSSVVVQDTYVTPSNQGTWTMLDQILAGNGVTYLKTLQYTLDPRLSSPNTFGVADLHQLLQSHVGADFWYREDIYMPGGGGYQHLGTAKLDTLTFSDTPEPSCALPLLSALLMFGVWKWRRTSTID
jgi:hypothetical protein